MAAVCSHGGGCEDSGERAIEHQEVRRIDIGRHAGRFALEDVALGVRRYLDDAEDLTLVERLLRRIHGRRHHRHRHGFVGGKGLDEVPAERRTIVVDHRDRDLAHQLPEIGLRVEDAIEQRRDDQQAEDRPIRHHATPFRKEGRPDPGFARFIGRSAFGPRLEREPAHQRPGGGKEADRHRREDCVRQRRGMGRRAPCGLVEKDLLVPAKRQERSPGARKASHRQHGNADPGEAEGGRRDDRRQA